MSNTCRKEMVKPCESRQKMAEHQPYLEPSHAMLLKFQQPRHQIASQSTLDCGSEELKNQAVEAPYVKTYRQTLIWLAD